MTTIRALDAMRAALTGTRPASVREDDWNILRRRHIDNATQKQVASEYHVSAPTIGTRERRGREALMQALFPAGTRVRFDPLPHWECPSTDGKLTDWGTHSGTIVPDIPVICHVRSRGMDEQQEVRRLSYIHMDYDRITITGVVAPAAAQRTITISLSENDYAVIDELAQAQDRTVSQQCRYMLRSSLHHDDEPSASALVDDNPSLVIL